MGEKTTLLHITNATIHTMDEKQPLVSSLLIHGGKVIACGDEQVAAYPCRESPAKLDLAGYFIIPALQDAHLHLEHYSLGLMKVDCETSTKAVCLQRIAEKAAVTPQGEWILGHGWNQNEWQDVEDKSAFPSAAELDGVAPFHPVFLTAKSLHAAWANSLALQIAKVTKGTANPLKGEVVYNVQGNPTGILLEEAMSLIECKLPKPTFYQLEKAMQNAQDKLAQVGIGGVHDFDGARCFAVLQSLHQQGNLNLRVLKSIPYENLSHAISLGLRSGFGDDMLRIGSLKLFMDGALGPRTAAMLAPYEGEPENVGILFMDAEEMFEIGREAVSHGLSLAVHAIGDRANHEVLKAYNNLRAFEHENGLPALRHRIEHLQLLHPEDVGSVAALGLIASMQPIHAVSDISPAERFWGARAAFGYAWKAQLQHGAALAFGSDAPVENPNPFWGLHAAITRRRWDGSPNMDGWYPEQRITLREALKAYTTGAAFTAGLEDRSGKLQPGYWADLTVLERDPFSSTPDEIKDIIPLATMVDGRWIWSDL